jgi:hypothetical protein
MRKNLRALPLAVMLQAVLAIPAFSQSNQPIGSANTVGSVSNFNANTGTNNAFTTNGTSPTSSPSLSPGTVILLPNGTRVSPSISTITVCDDITGILPNEIDVCRLR